MFMFQSKDDRSNVLRYFYEASFRLYPTDAHCRQALLTFKHGGIKCNECGNKDLEIKADRRDTKCRKCHKITWLTARTFFSRVKRPRAFLMVIICTGHGIAISANELAKIAGIAISSAQIIIKKIDTVIQSLMDQIGVVVDSALFRECIMRRSRSTPTNKDPVAELDELDANEHDGISSLPGLPAELLADITLIYNLLSAQPISFDALLDRSGLPPERISTALTILELEQLMKPCPGNNYIRSKTLPQSKEPSQQTFGHIMASLDVILDTFKGVSRKYLQNHLAFCWGILDRTKWGVLTLLKECARFRRVTTAEVTSYVSPRMVLVYPVAQNPRIGD